MIPYVYKWVCFQSGDGQYTVQIGKKKLVDYSILTDCGAILH